MPPQDRDLCFVLKVPKQQQNYITEGFSPLSSLREGVTFNVKRGVVIENSDVAINEWEEYYYSSNANIGIRFYEDQFEKDITTNWNADTVKILFNARYQDLLD